MSAGRIGKLECDFVLRSPEMEYACVQAAMTIMSDCATEDRTALSARENHAHGPRSPARSSLRPQAFCTMALSY